MEGNKLQRNKPKEVLKIRQGEELVKYVFAHGGPGQTPLLISELDENELQSRLEILQKQLAEYKSKCDKYKNDNAFYRNEIEVSERDTAEYIHYLESKKEEKLAVINQLIETKKSDEVKFTNLKQKIEEENREKIKILNEQIEEFEFELKKKEQEFAQLTDTITKRSRHYEQVAKIREEIRLAEINHEEKIRELDKNLLNTRIKLQKEADDKIKQMESAAEEKANQFLAQHALAIEKENTELEVELAEMTLLTQRLIEKKSQLDHEIQELERKKVLRLDLVEHRIRQIEKVEHKCKRRNEQKQTEKTKFRERLMQQIDKMRAGGSESVTIETNWEDFEDDD